MIWFSFSKSIPAVFNEFVQNDDEGQGEFHLIQMILKNIIKVFAYHPYLSINIFMK